MSKLKFLRSGAAIPEAPEHLSEPAKEQWRAICSEFELGDSSLLILMTALQCYDRAEEAAAELKAHGSLFVIDKYAQIRSHPSCAVEKQARALYLQAIKSLGLDLEPIGHVGRPAGR